MSQKRGEDFSGPAVGSAEPCWEAFRPEKNGPQCRAQDWRSDHSEEGLGCKYFARSLTDHELSFFSSRVTAQSS